LPSHQAQCPTTSDEFQTKHWLAPQIFEYKNNQLVTPPNSVVVEGPARIMAYLREHDTEWVGAT
jgi:hypothetical protein